jgi:predicted alpha/beta-fold hydrolase
MPLAESSYRAPRFLNNGHLLTIYPTLFRSVHDVQYERTRITTPDGDFLDLDISRIGSDRVVVLTHGLEGDSGRGYMRGMVRAVNQAGWDAVAWNCRGCSGETNRLPRFYHSGATEDLGAVIDHLLFDTHYNSLSLVGFSLGGNMTLKYLGERGGDLPEQLRSAVAISVPCDLASSADMLAHWSNRIYMRRFLRSLRDKVERKRVLLPGTLPEKDFREIRTFHEFDEYYTAPLHGFRDAKVYWERCSSRQFLHGIRIPTLLVNALDDPFLAPACFPLNEARENRCLTLETPASGGHVGFVRFNDDGMYWSEERAVEFLRQYLL